MHVCMAWQVGASLCLARVIDCAKDPHTHTLQQLCPRIVKLLNSPSFLANASLLPAIGGLAQVGLFFSFWSCSIHSTLNARQQQLQLVVHYTHLDGSSCFLVSCMRIFSGTSAVNFGHLLPNM